MDGAEKVKGFLTIKGEQVTISMPGYKVIEDLLTSAVPVAVSFLYVGQGPLGREIWALRDLQRHLPFLELELTPESQEAWLAECKADSISRENAKVSEGRPLVY